MRILSARLARFCDRYRADRRGAAGAEFALVLVLLTIPTLSVVDAGIYVYQRMELDNAAQAAAQKVRSTCNIPNLLPAKTNCTDFGAAVTAGAQSTPLGNAVSVTSVEGNYCVDSSGVLVSVGTAKNCSAVNSTSGDTPGDYIQITASYIYTPFFSTVSLASLLTSPITRTAWMRLN